MERTYTDYCALPEDGLRHEIIGGELSVTPAPSTYHQELVVKIAAQLLNRLRELGLGRVFAAPVDVVLSETDVVQPDIVVVLERNRSIVTPSSIQGAPDLVIEILSPSTRSRDLGIKKVLYEQAGAGEYWVVGPDDRHVHQFRREAGRFVAVGRHSAEITLAAEPACVLTLESIW